MAATQGPLTLDDVDLLDHDLFADHEPWEVFELLRREAPVFRHREPDGPGFWVVTGYEDVLDVLRDWETFSSELGGAATIGPLPEDVLAARRNFMETDPPRHTQFRRIFAAHFTPRAVKRYEPWLRELVTAVLDEALPLREFDLVHEVAAPIPIRALGRILGLADQHLPRLIWLGDRMLVDTEPEYVGELAFSGEQEEDRYLPFGSPWARELCELGREYWAARRASPQDDVLSLIGNAEIDGCPLSDRDLDNTFAIFVVAGNETTRQGISLGMLALARHPEHWQRLREDRSLVPGAVEEMLRIAGPVWHFRRTATRDTELGGQRISRGDRVVVWFGSANRDPDVFPDPHRFEITREPNDHATFGRVGPHFCLGAYLARLEITVLLEELLDRVERIELTGPPIRLRSNFTNGLRKLPVRVHLAS